MSIEGVIKNSQEQAVAAWVNMRNQLRLDELTARLFEQDINLENALNELDEIKKFVGDPAHILGSAKSKHGEIAEHMQVNFSNARRLIEGLNPEYTFEGVGRTAPEDYLKNGQQIQSKFLNGLHNTLTNPNGIKGHLDTYPDFVKNGGSYDIPKDQYEQMVNLLKKRVDTPTLLTKEERRILTSIDFFEQTTGLNAIEDISPSVVDYDQTQLGKSNETIATEEASIKETDQKLRNQAYDQSKPTLKQGAQAAGIAAAAEGGIQFCLGVHKKLKAGKSLHNFTAEDWQEIGIDTAKGAATGGFRGTVIYTMTNFTATSAPVANAFVTAVLGMKAQAQHLKNGKITEEDFIVNSEVICLDAAVGAVAALLCIGGATAAPAILGGLIANAACMMMYGIAKDTLEKREEKLTAAFKDHIEKLNKTLDARYLELIQMLQREFQKYTSILELAFDPQINVAFNGSSELADYIGVPPELVLRTPQDIDDYFLN